MSNYIFGTSLSYIDYLQARSFENSLKMEISQQSKAIIASYEQLQREHIAVSSRVMTEGFERLSLDLRQLSQGVSELTAAFEWGFSELLAAMGQVNEALAQPYPNRQNTAQTWAYEQFEIAGLSQATIGFITCSGYDPPWKFQESIKGSRGFGCGRECFPRHRQIRFGRSTEGGWSGDARRGLGCLLSRQMEAAKQHTDQALSLSPSLGEVHFQLAKIQMHTGEVTRALAPLQKAIELDRVYSVKAATG